MIYSPALIIIGILLMIVGLILSPLFFTSWVVSLGGGIFGTGLGCFLWGLIGA